MSSIAQIAPDRSACERRQARLDDVARLVDPVAVRVEQLAGVELERAAGRISA